MDDIFATADDLGPYRIVHVNRPREGLRAIVVVDNIACGPAIGGARIAPDVSLEECARLARAMSRKNASAGLPHGGGKAVIFADPKMPDGGKEQLIRSFACAIADITDYIVGPDMGTDERAMAWIKDEIGRAVGLPTAIGGIPLDEIGATGFGCAVAAEVAQEFCDVKLDGARVAIQGFGAVGHHAARFLAERGVVLVAASDSKGMVHDPDGIDIGRLAAIKADGGAVADYPHGKKLGREAILDVDCDVWIPAARPDVLDAGNVARLKARLVVQGANIPATPEAETIMHERGILSVPDFIANAGGVICASVEYHGGTAAGAFTMIEEKIRRNTRAVLNDARQRDCLPRAAADVLAERRIREAMALRRWS